MSVQKLKTSIFPKRFDFLFYSLLFLIFHPLIFPPEIAEHYVLPIAILIVFAASYLLFAQTKRWKRKALSLFYLLLFSLVLFFTYIGDYEDIQQKNVSIVINLIYMSYFVIIFIQLIMEMFRDDEFDIDMIYASLSGFILLNIITTFLFLLTEATHPNSFRGIDTNAPNIFDEYVYASFITLTSIGYGDIVPQSLWAKKVVMLMGTLGQFYIIVVVSLVVSKYASRGK